jgi:hypothetical protein
MKPTKPGYYWYKSTSCLTDEVKWVPAEVILYEGVLCTYSYSDWSDPDDWPVSNTADSDWDGEIVHK